MASFALKTTFAYLRGGRTHDGIVDAPDRAVRVSHPRVLFTIGHSLQPISQFCSRLTANGIDLVFDVRSYPYSNRAPQFSQPVLCDALAALSVRYVFAGDVLGGRPRRKEFYDNLGQAQYDLIAESGSFRAALRKLILAARNSRPVLLCAEANPLDCHRFLLIARHLRSAALDIRHILADGRIVTQAEAEEQLLVKVQLAQVDMFSSKIGALERAYNLRSCEVAYLRSSLDENADIEAFEKRER